MSLASNIDDVASTDDRGLGLNLDLPSLVSAPMVRMVVGGSPPFRSRAVFRAVDVSECISSVSPGASAGMGVGDMAPLWTRADVSKGAMALTADLTSSSLMDSSPSAGLSPWVLRVLTLVRL